MSPLPFAPRTDPPGEAYPAGGTRREVRDGRTGGRRATGGRGRCGSGGRFRLVRVAVAVAVAVAAGARRAGVRIPVALLRLAPLRGAVPVIGVARLAVGPLVGEPLLQPLLVLVVLHPVQAVVVERVPQAVVRMVLAVAQEHADRLDTVARLPVVEARDQVVERLERVLVTEVVLAEERGAAVVLERLEVRLDVGLHQFRVLDHQLALADVLTRLLLDRFGFALVGNRHIGARGADRAG